MKCNACTKQRSHTYTCIERPVLIRYIIIKNEIACNDSNLQMAGLILASASDFAEI